MGVPANMRLSALTDELALPDSINEIVAFATVAFFASARCESWQRKRTIRNRNLHQYPLSFFLHVNCVKNTITLYLFYTLYQSLIRIKIQS